MRVLAAIVAPPHLAVSGGARAGELLSNALTPHCDMTVASMVGAERAESTRPTRVPVATFLPPLLPWRRMPNNYRTLFYRSNIPDIIRKGSFDLVHIHNPIPALEMGRVARACQCAHVPYVVSTHGFNEVANGASVYRFGTLRRALWKQLVERPVAETVRGASALFVLSPADLDIVRRMGADDSSITVVSNGVDPPPAENVDADRMALQRLGISPERTAGQITCMFLANHTPNKGLPVLIEAFAGMERPFLLIIGGDKRAGIDYDAALRACRPGQQIVVTGLLSHTDLPAVFRRSDVFVFPTLADTFPLVVLEAMAYGLPVVASRVGGIPHQVDTLSGILVSAGDSRELANAIGALADDPSRRMAMGGHARRRTAASFKWSDAAMQALSGYEGVLRRARQHEMRYRTFVHQAT